MKVVKEFVSTIRARYGVFDSVPKKYEDSNKVLISFVKKERNILEVSYRFDKTHYTRVQAEEYSKNLTAQIALGLTLKNLINTDWEINVRSKWQEDSKDKTVGTAAINGRAAIVVGAIEIDVSSFVAKTKHTYAIECFNRSLFHKESATKDESAIAIWLRLGWEAIQIDMNVNERALKADIVQRRIVPRGKLNEFKKSIGKYYVHEKRQSSVIPLAINDCTEIMHKILLHYCI